MSVTLLKKQDVLAAAERIRPYIYSTPVLQNEEIDNRLGCQVVFKCENLQRTGSFKLRGALNAIKQVAVESKSRPIVTHSSGNHGAAVACAAREFHLDCTVIMPKTAPAVKQDNVRRYGARIVLCEPTMAARQETTKMVLEQDGGILVHPFDDYAIMAGQGTAALELLQAVFDLDVILTPVGGGGLLSGTATIAKALKPDITALGVEPAAANDQQLSFQQKTRITISDPATIADGLRTTCPGEKPFQTILAYADNILTVSEQSIRQALRLIWEHLKIVVEPSGAVPLAALLEHSTEIGGRRRGVILSGGNLDLDTWSWA